MAEEEVRTISEQIEFLLRIAFKKLDEENGSNGNKNAPGEYQEHPSE